MPFSPLLRRPPGGMTTRRNVGAATRNVTAPKRASVPPETSAFSNQTPLQLSAGPLRNYFRAVGSSEAGIGIGLCNAVYFSADRRVLLRTDGRTSLEVTIVRL